MSAEASEENSYFHGAWKPPTVRAVACAFLGPFLLFIILMLGAKYTTLTWANGSFGAAAVILFCFPDSPPSSPRHMYLGQILSALVAFLFMYAIPSPSLMFIRVSLAVATSTALMKLIGITYPPGGATAFLITTGSIEQWSKEAMFMYLLFPLIIGTTILLVLALFLNNVFRNSATGWYPKMFV